MTIEEYTGVTEEVLKRICEEEGLDFEEEFNIPFHNYSKEIPSFEEWVLLYGEDDSISLLTK